MDQDASTEVGLEQRRIVLDGDAKRLICISTIARLSQRDRVTHELLRFAKCEVEFLSHHFGGLGET